VLTVEEALERCLTAARPVDVEFVGLDVARGRVLARDLTAGVDLPHWDNSAMDGYAVRAEDLGALAVVAGDGCDDPGAGRGTTGVALRIVETVAAGGWPQQRVESGEACRIMTGAPMPEGADAVVMREDCDVEQRGDGEHVIVRRGARVGDHVRRQGEELRRGAAVFTSGRTLSPAAIGVCAALGYDSLPVARRPRIGILATGDEVMPPGRPLGPGQIWSSNSAALAALVEEAGALPIDCGIAPDNLDGTRMAFEGALARDVQFLISTGGVSVGDFDFVRDAMASRGSSMDFWKVKMKPGKPLAFGQVAGVPIFGLPGNPVSCLVNFLQFVRPVIRRSLGDPRPFLPVREAVLTAPIRHHPGRAELVRVALAWDEEGRLQATPAGNQGSNRALGMAVAHGLLLVGDTCSGINAGERRAVQVYDWSFGDGAAPSYSW
jgi:molybdopterin molybdotransferase